MHIDKLIKAAPDVPPPPVKSMWEEYEAAPKVGYKTYTLLNCKSVLRAFKKMRAYTPKKPKRAPGVKRLNKRTLFEDVNYKVPYMPRKVTKLPEFMTDQAHAAYYVDGFYCNKHLMVRMDAPKTKRPLDCEQDRMSDMIKEATINVGEPVAVLDETFNGALGDVVPHAHFYGVKTHVIVDARYLDVIYKYHPDTRARHSNQQINFFNGEELVGSISLMRD